MINYVILKENTENEIILFDIGNIYCIKKGYDQYDDVHVIYVYYNYNDGAEREFWYNDKDKMVMDYNKLKGAKLSLK